MKLQKDNTRTAHPILTFRKDLPGILVCLAIALPSWYLGKVFPLVGGAIIAIVAGMVITGFWTDKGIAQSGIKFTSKIILQTAVVLLGFGMNLWRRRPRRSRRRAPSGRGRGGSRSGRSRTPPWATRTAFSQVRIDRMICRKSTLRSRG